MLDLGAISGVIGLDTAPLNKALGQAKTSLKQFSTEAAAESEKGGEEGGKRYASGWSKKALLLAGAGATAVGAVFVSSLAKSMNLEPATDKVAASLGLTEVEADKASKAAGKLYSSNWGESMEDAARRTGIVIGSVVGMREASAEEVARMTGLFSAFSDGFEIDMGRATQVVGQMVKEGLVKDTEEGLNILTATLQKVPVAVREDVLDAVDEYGPFMQQLGISGESAMKLLAESAEKGMYGIDKTGDALKEFTIRATDMSTASKVGYDLLGMSQKEMSAELLKGGEAGEKAFSKIITGLRDIEDPVEQSKAALALFGTPLEDLNTGEIPGFLDGLSGLEGGLGDTSDAAQKMADTMGDSPKAKLSSFFRSLEQGAVDVIGGQVLPKLDEAVGGLQDFGRWIQDNEDWLGPLTVAVGLFGGALGMLGLVGYIASIGGLSGALSLLHGKIVAATVVTYAKNAAELVAAGASKALAAGQWLVNAAMSANPLGIVILLLAGLVAAFVLAYQNSEDFRRIVDGALSAVKGAADRVGKWFMKDFVGFFKKAGQWIGDQFDGIGKWFNRTGDDLKKTGKRIGDFFTKDVPRSFSKAAEAIGAAFGKVKDFILKPIREAAAWINNSFVSGVNKFLGGIGISWRVPEVPGFADGGYTGNGPKWKSAGEVHAGEVVWSQEDIAAHGGVENVEGMRRSRPGYANGGIVANATQGFRGYDPAALAAMKAWAAATGRRWFMTGLGGARSRAQQALLYARYKAGIGPLAASPNGNGPHLMPAVAMDLSPRPGENPAARALLPAFGLGLTVRGEPWHVGYLKGRGGAAATGGGGADFIGGIISGLIGKMPGFQPPWGDILKKVLGKTASGIASKAFGFDNGGWLQPGRTLVDNQTGQREMVLSPEQVSERDRNGGGMSVEDFIKALGGAQLKITGFDHVLDRAYGKLLLGADRGI